MTEGTSGRLRYGRHFGEVIGAAARLELLRTGIHQGLFEALRVPQSGDALAERLGLARDLVLAWLRATETHGLLERNGSDYRIGGFVRWLLDAPEANALHAHLDQAALSILPRLGELPELMKGAERPAYGSPQEALRVAAGARLHERRALRALARVPGLRRARRVLDVGCGYGTYLAGLLTRYRDAQGLGVELDPEVAEEARRTLREAEVWRRAEVRTGDFMSLDLPQGSYDLALVNNSLHYFAPAERNALFRRVRGRLAPGGVLAVQTAVAADNLSARMFGNASAVATSDLYLRCHRDLHGLPLPDDTRRALLETGFAETGVVTIVSGGTALYIWGRAGAPPSSPPDAGEEPEGRVSGSSP